MTAIVHWNPKPVPEQFRSILQRIADLFGQPVYIRQIGYEGDPNWLSFSVAGMTDWWLFTKLYYEKHQVFREDPLMSHYQVLYPSHAPRGGSGVWIGYKQWEYPSDFTYY